MKDTELSTQDKILLSLSNSNPTEEDLKIWDVFGRIQEHPAIQSRITDFIIYLFSSCHKTLDNKSTAMLAMSIYDFCKNCKFKLTFKEFSEAVIYEFANNPDFLNAMPSFFMITQAFNIHQKNENTKSKVIYRDLEKTEKKKEFTKEELLKLFLEKYKTGKLSEFEINYSLCTIYDYLIEKRGKDFGDGAIRLIPACEENKIKIGFNNNPFDKAIKEISKNDLSKLQGKIIIEFFKQINNNKNGKQKN